MKVEQSAKAYYEYARDVGGTGWAGSAYDSYEFDRHQCAIIGRMLGMEEVIRDLETMPYPPMDTSSDPHSLLVFSISLDNWVIAARRALEMSEGQRKSVWNLDCVGHLGIATSYYLANADPDAHFKVTDGTLFVYGDIDSGFYERFRGALDADTSIAEVALGSGGGSVRDALLSGYEIRSRGLNTTIYGNCFSACPLVFVGGISRVVWSSPSQLGFHQVSREGEAVAASDEIYVLTAQYLVQMGVDAPTVLGWMLSTPPEGMYEPPLEELCTPRVATWVQRMCGF